MSSEEGINRELERRHAQDIARSGGELRPWHSRPVVWAGVIGAGGLLAVLFVVFLLLAQ